MQAGDKVALNTAIQYGRMLLTVGVSLYSTRLVLDALGVQDFGIFNLIAGVIAMLAFFNNAMSTSTQRFLSLYQGRNDLKMQQKVFASSIVVHFLIGVVIVLSIILAGLFLFEGFLNIPQNRLQSAKTIYYFMSATVFFTVISVPFTGSLVAHENMLWVAIVNIVEVLLKLATAFCLYLVSADKLIFYGLFTLGISISSCLLYAVFCFKKYESCTLKGVFPMDMVLSKELTSFAGWNLFGSLCGLGRTQGLAVLINLFFGTVLNASYGIANQVTSQLNFFSTTMLKSLNPQIMKSEGAQERQRMLRLSIMACKFGFYLLAFVAVPCIFEMPRILEFWLKNVPPYAVVFCRLSLLAGLINQLTIGLVSGLQAVGKIKYYQSVVGTLLLLNLPVAYLLLRLELPVYTVLLSYICIEIIACVLRVTFIKTIAGMSVKEYITKVLLAVSKPLMFNIVLCALLVHFIQHDYRFLLTIPTSILVFLAAIYILGLGKEEKNKIDAIISKLAYKILKK
jgi:O-antigen/teichoic acid export membrane protein